MIEILFSEVWLVVNMFEGLTLVFNTLALFLYVVLTRRNTAFTIVISGLIALDIAHQHYRLYLMSLFGQESIKEIVTFAWYVGFAITDLAFVVLASYLIRKLNAQKDRASQFVLVAFLIMAALQIIRYSERVIVGTDYTAMLYQNGIVAMNVAVSIVVVSAVFRLLVFVLKTRRIGDYRA